MITDLDETLRSTRGQIGHFQLVSGEVREALEVFRSRVEKVARLLEKPSFQAGLIMALLALVFFANMLRAIFSVRAGDHFLLNPLSSLVASARQRLSEELNGILRRSRQAYEEKRLA